MQVVVLANDLLKDELLQRGAEAEADLIWISHSSGFAEYARADVFVDLLFEQHPHHLPLLQALLPKPVVISSVAATLAETDPSFVRINGWPTFLQPGLLEAACLQDDLQQGMEAVFALLHQEVTWLPDAPGFITPRVISMIVNEAYLALEEGVSTAEEIDTAMQLGTAYPYGPFTWGQRIGLRNVVRLLEKLSGQQPHYAPARLLAAAAAAENRAGVEL